MRRQNGRSMIEMLGVLALIGTLTIGGVWGYRRAVDYYHANVILKEVELYHFTLEEKNRRFDENGRAVQTDFVSGSGFEYQAWETDQNYWEIDVSEVSNGTCRILLERAEPSASYYKIGTYVIGVTHNDMNSGFALYKGNDDICHAGNTMIFFVGNTAHLCEEDCPAGKNCHYGVCCSAEQQCGKNCCGDDEICCGDRCMKNTCGTDENGIELVFDKARCGCFCPIKSGFRENPEEGVCQCNTDNGFVLNEGACTCPSTQVNINGVCGTVGCYTDSNKKTVCTQAFCQCYFNDERCGHHCMPDAQSCQTGVCPLVSCPAETEWRHDPRLDSGSGGLSGCFINNNLSGKGVICLSGSCYLYQTEQQCGAGCDLGGTCSTGWCQECEVGTFAKVGQLYGCDLGNGILCTKVNNKFYCYKDGETCASGCSGPNLDNCTTNLCLENTCPETTNYTTSGTEGIRCENDGFYCLMVHGAVNCYLSNGELCGTTCDFKGNCQSGSCTPALCAEGQIFARVGNLYGCYSPDLGVGCFKSGSLWMCNLKGTTCAYNCSESRPSISACLNGTCDPSQCPEGFSHTFLDNWSMGCRNETTGLACLPHYGAYYCWKNGVVCGSKCSDYFGTGCPNCLSDTFKCEINGVSTGGEAIQYWNQNACYYPLKELVCQENGTCYFSGPDVSSGGSGPHRRCGTGCALDGSNCSVGVCLATECESDESWEYDSANSVYKCVSRTGLECIGGTEEGQNWTCSVGDSQCGINCSKFGENCGMGVCLASECGSLSLKHNLTTGNFFGCYNADTQTLCYSDSTGVKPYVCYRRGVVVGWCDNLNGTSCSCAAGYGSSSVDGRCEFCPKGTSSAAGGACLPCPEGMFANGSWPNCQSCGGTTYAAGTGNVSCKPCGDFATAVGARATHCVCTDPNLTWHPDTGNGNGCNAEQQGTPCATNNDCREAGLTDYFCEYPKGYQSRCVPLSDYGKVEFTAGGISWLRGNKSMTFNTARSFCEAYGKKLVSKRALGCEATFYTGYTYCTNGEEPMASLLENADFKGFSSYWLSSGDTVYNYGMTSGNLSSTALCH